jgi:hypothetical protein
MTMLNSRRSFVLTLGASVSAALVPAMSSASTIERNEVDDPALRAALLEEEKALRRLHDAFEKAQDGPAHDAVIAMFTDDAEVVFNGGLFRGRAEGVTRLYRDRFPAGGSGRRMQPAPGFELAADRQQDSVQVFPDRLSATAVFPYSLQVGAPLEDDSSLVSMARLHGEGVRTWWEGGVYEVAYLKRADGVWQIRRLEYRTLARADYRSGRTYAAPMSVSRFSTRFPRDPAGPDEIA